MSSATYLTQDKTEWTVDERLSNISKGTQITPIITIVFYTGEIPWDGPKSLHDMMEIDDRVKPFVPDYQVLLVDLGHDKELPFSNRELEEIRMVLEAIYSDTASNNTENVYYSTLALAGILTQNVNLYKISNQKGKEKEKMCRALEKRDRIIFKEQFELIEQQSQEIQQQSQEIEQLSLEVERLKKLLEKAGISLPE